MSAAKSQELEALQHALSHWRRAERIEERERCIAVLGAALDKYKNDVAAKGNQQFIMGIEYSMSMLGGEK